MAVLEVEQVKLPTLIFTNLTSPALYTLQKQQKLSGQNLTEKQAGTEDKSTLSRSLRKYSNNIAVFIIASLSNLT